MSLQQFTFKHKTKLYIGAYSLEQIPSELDQKSVTRILIVTDKESVKRGALKTFAKAFSKYDIVINVYDRIKMHAKEQQVEEVITILKKTKSGAIVALGGIEAIDTVRDANKSVSMNLHSLPMIAIPTSVQERTCMSSPPNTPLAFENGTSAAMYDALILDERVLYCESAQTLNRRSLAALFHAIEASIGPESNSVSRSFAFAALTILREHDAVSKETSGKGNLLHIANAIHLADLAFSNTKMGLGVSLLDFIKDIADSDPSFLASFFLAVLIRLRMVNQEKNIARLLWPLSGPEVYANTPKHQQAEQTIETVMAILSDLNKSAGAENMFARLSLTNGMSNKLMARLCGDEKCLQMENLSSEDIKTAFSSVFKREMVPA